MMKKIMIVLALAAVSLHAIDLKKQVSIHISTDELNRTYVLGWGSKLMDFAVRDFADHLNRACPGTWAINPQVPAKQRILLGKKAVQTYRLQDSAKKLIFGAYRIKTIGNDLLIYGNDAQSTINGMYAFLEDHLGYHWFTPRDEFRIDPPKGRSMKFDRIDETVKPDFLTREMKGYGYPGTPGFIWGIRNRLFKIGRHWDLTVNHNVYFLLPAKQYAKTHPEYYSMKENGTRALPPNTQMCYSNPDVLEIVCRKAEQHFRRGRDRVAFSLCPSDNHVFCRCPGCKATQPPRKEDIYCFTDMHMAFVEKVADRIKDKYPDRRLGVFAYAGTLLPPVKKMRNGKSYILAITPDFSQYSDQEYRKRELANYRAWLKQIPGSAVHWHAYTALCQVAPCYFPSLLSSAIKTFYNQFQARSFLADGGGGFWPVTGAQSWMAGKLLWNVKADPEKLLNEYYTTLYGPAAPTIRKLYDRLEKSYLAGSRTGGKWLRNHGTLTVFNYYKAEDVLYCRKIWQEARTIAKGHPEILRRIDYMAIRMEMVLQMLEAWDLCHRLAGGKPIPPAYGSKSKALAHCVRTVCGHEAKWQKVIRTDLALDQFAFHKRRPGFDYYKMLRDQWHSVCSENLAKELAKNPDRELEKLFIAKPIRAALLGLEQKKYTLKPELLRNPGFEIGKAPGPAKSGSIPEKALSWDVDSSSPESFQYGRVLNNTQEGKHCGLIRGERNCSFLTTCRVDLTKGSRFFILEAQALKKKPETRIYLRIMWRDKAGKFVRGGFFRSADFEGTGKWSKRRIIAEAPEKAGQAVILLCAENLKGSEALFDAVSFRQIKF